MSGMRRRGSGSGRHGRTNSFQGDQEEDSKITKTMKRLDFYARVDDDMTVKTTSGATVSVVFVFMFILLVGSELYSYLYNFKGQEEFLRVDTTLGTKLEISLNMTFHTINCLDLHVDAMDVAGENQIDVEHAMLKQRLTADGQRLGLPISEAANQLEHRATLPDNYCGDCYGDDERGKKAAEADLRANGAIRCCSTCHEVTESFALRGWSTVSLKDTAEQCVRESHLEIPLQIGEGCNLSGLMKVNKVAGNFHIAMGESMVKDGRHVHLFSVEDSPSFNISHTIYKLSFGDRYPNMPPNPLDGSVSIIDEEVGTGLMQYYINLVPTIFRPSDSGSDATKYLTTTQFTYTMKFRSIYGYDDFHPLEHHDAPGHHHAIAEHSGEPKVDPTKNVRPITNFLLPGVFFVYDMAPFLLDVRETYLPVHHFLIRLCAVAGGMYTVSGMLDRAIYYVITHMKGHGLLPA